MTLASLLAVEGLLLLAQSLLVTLLELRLLLRLVREELLAYLLVVDATTDDKHNDHREEL